MENIVLDAFKAWKAGGMMMYPLFAIAVVIYAIAIDLLLYFRRKDFKTIPDEVWAGWIENPREGQGEVGEIIRYTQDEVHSLEDIRNRFEEIRSAKIPRINRRLVFLHILVGAAPLMGLLGTVLGMIKTFEAISTGMGNTADLVAGGIAEALITTETGLLIALPGLFLAYVIRGKRIEYEAFLMRLESSTMRHYQKEASLVLQ
jgi:biopolymer transport protein ExbB